MSEKPTYEELVEALDDMISMASAYAFIMPDRDGHNRARVDVAESLLVRARQEIPNG